MTPELFPVDRSGWKAAADTKPEQLKIDLPESSRPADMSPPGGPAHITADPMGPDPMGPEPRVPVDPMGPEPMVQELNSRYVLKLVPRSGAGPAAGCTWAPPPHITPSRLAVLAKMAIEKNCYL